MTQYISNSDKHYYGFIDGLRAIAVLMVLIFHLNPTWLSGGFIGVDVFFTISGFLITQILIEKKELPYSQFILARFRRLAPAMALVILSVVLIGTFIISLPSEISSLTKSVITSSSYISNIFYFSTSNYFDSTKESNMLLHTWSLAVEWQFYFIYPFFIYIFARGRFAVLTLLAITIFSLISAVVYIGSNIDAVFYLTPFRAFEFSLGGLVFALLKNPKVRKLKPKNLFAIEAPIILGICLLIFLSITYNEDTTFPGLNALWVSIATCSILLTGLTFSQNSKTVLMLDNSVMRYIGAISYSLYLWHWPIIIGVRMYVPELSIVNLATVTFVCFVSAALTHRYVENQLRRNTLLNSRLALGIASAPLIVGLTLFGLNKTKPELFNSLTVEQNNLLNVQRWADVPGVCTATHKTHEYYDCIVGSPNEKPNIIIYGDSHAQVYVWAIHKALMAEGRSARYLTKGGCPPLLGVAPTRTTINKAACLALQNIFHDLIKGDYVFDTILISARWSLYNEQSYGSTSFDEELSRMVLTAAERAENLVLLDNTPEAPASVPELIVRNLQRGRVLQSFTNHIGPYVYLHSLKSEKIRIVDIQNMLCNSNHECPYFVDGKLVYFDSNHLTESITTDLLKNILKTGPAQLGTVNSDITSNSSKENN